MALPIVTILEYLFKAGPVLKAASDIVKKNRKDSSHKVNTVEVGREYKVELLEKKLIEHARFSNELNIKLEETLNEMVKIKRSVIYWLYLIGIALIASIAALTVAILK